MSEANNTCSDQDKLEQIDKYLQECTNHEKVPVSFLEIMLGFILDDPKRAAIFSNDRSIRVTLELLKEAAILLENNFKNLEFEYYLQLCVTSEFQPKIMCALSQWYDPVLTYGNEKTNIKSIHYTHIPDEENPSILFNLRLPHNKTWIKKNVALTLFSESEQKIFLASKNIRQKKLAEKVISICSVMLFYINRPPKQEIFELITHVVCYALAIYNTATTTEDRSYYLLNASKYMEKVTLVNLAQGKKAQNLRTDALQKLILCIVKVNPEITRKQLLKELEKYVDDVIYEINEDLIYFFIDDKDQIKSATTSGLKDRLRRAKEEEVMLDNKISKPNKQNT